MNAARLEHRVEQLERELRRTGLRLEGDGGVVDERAPVDEADYGEAAARGVSLGGRMLIACDMLTGAEVLELISLLDGLQAESAEAVTFEGLHGAGLRGRRALALWQGSWVRKLALDGLRGHDRHARVRWNWQSACWYADRGCACLFGAVESAAGRGLPALRVVARRRHGGPVRRKRASGAARRRRGRERRPAARRPVEVAESEWPALAEASRTEPITRSTRRSRAARCGSSLTLVPVRGGRWRWTRRTTGGRRFSRRSAHPFMSRP